MRPVHWSDLRWLSQSPAHYRHRMLNPTQPTTAMQIGTAVHQLVLNGARNYVVWPGVRRGKDWDAFAALFDGSDCAVLTQTEHETAYAIATAVLEHKQAAQLLGHYREIELAWTQGDRECQGTPDATDGAGYLADLKVVHSADPKRFQWHAENQGWLGQMAWYRNAIWAAYGERCEDAYIVAVESKPPHCVQVYRLTSGALEVGDRIWRSLFEQLLVCEASDHWPGYAQTELPLDVSLDVSLNIDGDEFPF